MGGELEDVARYPDGAVKIMNFPTYKHSLNRH